MTDARATFQRLRDSASGAYDASSAPLAASSLHRRVARARTRRVALAAVSSVAIAAALYGALVGGPWGTDAAPAHSGSSSPTPSESTGTADAWPAWCVSATVVEGKAAGNLGGLEGWFNGTQDAPCDEWDEQVKQHPDTVLINTTDNTMMEAYYRTSRGALGVYANLGDGFVVPNPDPTWPAASLVLIDARTGEVLLTDLLSNYADTSGAHDTYPSPSSGGSLESSG